MTKKKDYYKTVFSYLEKNQVKANTKRINYDGFDDDIAYYVSRNLIQLRNSLGYSQKKFSSLLNISISQYKKYESGLEVIRFDVSQRLSLKLGYPNIYLLAGSRCEDLLNIPSSIVRLGKIWYFANSLKNDKFVEYCRLLAAVFNQDISSTKIPYSDMTKNDFEKALNENISCTYIAIGEGIRAIRHYLNMSQVDVAELMGVSHNAYQSYERSSQTPRFNMTISARYLSSLGINSLAIVQGTYYLKVREMQNRRLQTLIQILDGISEEHVYKYSPIIDGYFQMIASSQDAQYYSLEI